MKSPAARVSNEFSPVLGEVSPFGVAVVDKDHKLLSQKRVKNGIFGFGPPKYLPLRETLLAEPEALPVIDQ